MKIRSLIFLAFLALPLFSGCGHSDDDVSTGVTGPQVQPTQEFPAVVKVLSLGQLCTGVFVSPKALLTASHCVRPGSPVTVQTPSGRLQSSQVIPNGPGAVGDSRDLAVVLFSQPVTGLTGFYPIGQAYQGETVYLVGYGCNDVSNPSGTGIKRFGTNTVHKITQYLEVLSPVRAPSPRSILGPMNRAGSCFGDSGGPMLKANGNHMILVGIDHAIIPENNQQISAYTDLTKRENLEFLRRVNAQYTLEISGL